MQFLSCLSVDWQSSWYVQAEQMRVKETARKTNERDARSAELRAQLEADAAALRKAQKATETERTIQKVYKSLTLHSSLDTAALRAISRIS